jgi:hypothetical protein
MPETTKPGPSEVIRDRVNQFRRVPARELLDNDGNPRRYPQAQRDALRGLLEQVGVAAALTAYYSVRHGGQLVLIDGHCRKQDYDLDWPPLILDVNDAEADLLLASHDPLTALAEYDRGKLDGLLQSVRAKSPALLSVLKDLATKTAARADRGGKDPGVTLPKERFEIVVECSDECHQRVLFDRFTEEGLKCRVLTF